jgi:hypothetical protein
MNALVIRFVCFLAFPAEICVLFVCFRSCVSTYFIGLVRVSFALIKATYLFN